MLLLLAMLYHNSSVGELTLRSCEGSSNQAKMLDRLVSLNGSALCCSAGPMTRACAASCFGVGRWELAVLLTPASGMPESPYVLEQDANTINAFQVTSKYDHSPQYTSLNFGTYSAQIRREPIILIVGDPEDCFNESHDHAKILPSKLCRDVKLCHHQIS